MSTIRCDRCKAEIDVSALNARVRKLEGALREIAVWGMHSGAFAYQKGEHDESGYYNNAFYLMEREISEATELARKALADKEVS